MSKQKKTFAEQINNAGVMISGLENHKEELEQWGLNAAFITALTTKRDNASTTNSEQEKLKADLKSITANLDSQMENLQTDMSTATAIIKRVIPKEQWKEFGITVSR